MDRFAIIGRKIRYERRRKKLSRNKLAEMTELSTYFIGQIERGQTKMSVETLITIAEHLNLSLDYLICEQVAENKEIKELFATNLSTDTSMICPILSSLNALSIYKELQERLN